MPKPRFKAGDTITNGKAVVKVVDVIRDSYKVKGSKMTHYMPIALVDRLWLCVVRPNADGVYESEIVEE